MGSSFIEYRGYGYWSRDSFIESWILTLTDEIQKQSPMEPWLRSLADEWKIQSSIDGGCIHLDLDRFLLEDARRLLIVGVSEKAAARCPKLGARTGELFVKLLSGDLKTNSSSPIDYI